MNDILQDQNYNNYSNEADIEGDTITPDSVLNDKKTKSRHIICLENAKKMELANKIFASQRLDKFERALAYTFICGEKPPLVRRGPKVREDAYFSLAIEFLDMKSAGMRTNSITNVNVILKRFGLSKTDKNINQIKYTFKLSKTARQSKVINERLSLDRDNKLSKNNKTEIIEIRGIKSYLGEKYKLQGGDEVNDKNFYAALNKGIELVIERYGNIINNTKTPSGFCKYIKNYLNRAIEYKNSKKRMTLDS